AATQRVGGGFREVEGGRSQQDRCAGGAGFDQILAAVVKQAATDQRHIGKGVVGRHFAHAIAQPYLRVGGGFVAAAPPACQSQLLHQRRDFVETLRMARYQDQKGVGTGFLPGGEQQLF